MTDIGPALREARMRAHIDISEIEQRTKIRAKYLRAIENEEWNLLPGHVYVKSFLRTYGDALGLDSRSLVDEYKRRYEGFGEHESPLATIGRDRAERPRSQGRSSGRSAPPPKPPGPAGQRSRLRIGPTTVLVVVILLIIAALAAIGSLGGKKSSNQAANKITPASHGQTHHHKQTPQSGAGGSKSKSTTTAAPKLATLALVPTGDVWVCVENEHHKALIPGTTYAVGQTVPRTSGSTLLVTLGNGNATVTANGKPYPLKASSGAIAFSVDGTGVRPLSSGPTCGK